MKVLEDVIGHYGFSPAITSVLRFLLRNPYESLVIVNRDGKLEFMDRGSKRRVKKQIIRLGSKEC